MTAAQIKPTPNDRLSLTLSIAILMHILIIFGISFTMEDRPNTRMNMMEIVLVNQETSVPKETNILAQKNLEGGGEIEEVIEPTTSVKPSLSESKQHVVDSPSLQEELLHHHNVEMSETEIPEILDVNKENIETIAVENIEDEIVDLTSEKQKPDFVYEKLDKLDTEKKLTKKPPPPSIPTSDELLSNSFEIATSNNEVRREMIERTKKPIKKYISATTKEYEYAAYMDAWRRKVERVGNLNYPEEVKDILRECKGSSHYHQ